MSRLEAHAYEWDFQPLCTVTFWQKVDFLIINVYQNSRLCSKSSSLHLRTFEIKWTTSQTIRLYLLLPKYDQITFENSVDIRFLRIVGNFWLVFSTCYIIQNILLSKLLHKYTIFNISIRHDATSGEIWLKSPQFSENPSDVRVFKANVVTFGKYTWIDSCIFLNPKIWSRTKRHVQKS